MKPPLQLSQLPCRLLQEFPATRAFNLRLNKFNTLCLLLALLLSISITTVEGGMFCATKQVGCDFEEGFMHKKEKRYSCLDSAQVDGNIPENLSTEYFCKTNVSSIEGLGFSWGACVQDATCLDDNDEPQEFLGEMAFAGKNCLVQALPCVFPFKHQGVTYNECANMPVSAKSESSSGKWCATAVDESGVMIPNLWNICDESTCEKSKEAEVLVDSESNANQISMNVSFTQKSRNHQILVRGVFGGLPAGKYAVAIHQKKASGDDCAAAGDYVKDDEGNVIVSDVVESDGASDAKYDIGISGEAMSLYPGQILVPQVLNKTLVVHKLQEGGMVSDTVERLACGVIKLPVREEDESLMLIIIIVCVIIVVILLAIIVFLICKCMRSKKRKGRYDPTKAQDSENNGDIIKENGDVQNATDCISDSTFGLHLKLIDATPDGSPRPGRSTDRLAYLNSRNSSIGRSAGSLSDENYAYKNLQC